MQNTLKVGSFAGGIAAAAVALCLAVAAWFTPNVAWGLEAVDVNATGSIQVTQQTAEGNAVPGGTITLYQVATIDNSGDEKFVFTKAFENSGADLSDLSASDLAAKLVAAIPEGTEGTTQKFDSTGKAAFGNLSVGVYLLVQEEAASGYSAISPFVVAVPIRNADGSLTYSVDATPKMSTVTAEKPTTPTTPSDSTLPQTGQLLWPIVVLASAGVVLFCIGWVMRRKSEGSHEA